jgi:hypothetical protein
MSVTISGKIERKGFGMGTWALVADDGKTYELKDAPEQLRQSGIQAKVTGEIKNDLMTLAMIGPVLEVSDFETE